MIELQDVTKIYATAKGDVHALDHLSLEVSRGEFVAVRGPSGCGKSTLLALLGGLARPTTGKVLVADLDVGTLSPGVLASFRAEKIGFVFQMFHLLPYLTVLDNVLVAATDSTSTETRDRAHDLLCDFGLEPRLSHTPGELSAGERQRVAMARALLNQPQVLLADEPTGNLDPKNAEGLLDLVRGFHESGGTVLMVTHEEQAANYAQRTISLEKGQLSPVAAE